MPLIGTAGHVDHGKSSLVQRLTGRDPDRWEEEKRRGLTIDLGFAWADLGGDVEASFVDVPGHERYLKNMLAGVEAIDIALFVVAANEGWMPQSEEHLAALDLLEVDSGIVALTKSDLVDRETLEIATLEVTERIAGTSLQDAEILAVSSVTGAGIDEVARSLHRLARDIERRETRPRLWVDRVFSISGTGTVVTGSLLGGPLAVGDAVEIYPSGEISRIRSIQSHERASDSAQPWRRVALGLAGVSTDQIERGSMVGRPDSWTASSRFSCTLRPARYLAEIPVRGAYQAHIGSGAQNAEIERLTDGYGVIRLQRPVPLAMGDRFIVRDSGRRIVAGGGRVLDPRPGTGRAAVETAQNLDPGASVDDRASQLLTIRGVDTAENLWSDTDGGRPETAIEVAGHFLTEATLDSYRSRAIQLVEADHLARPLHDGIPLATLAGRIGIDIPLAAAVVERATGLELRGPTVAEAGHQARLSDQMAAVWDTAQAQLKESGLEVPPVAELGLPAEAIHLLVRADELIRVGSDFVFLPAQIGKIVEAVTGLDQPFSVGDVKEALGLSRKYVVPILEWLDSNNYTSRRENVRVFGARLSGDDQ